MEHINFSQKYSVISCFCQRTLWNPLCTSWNSTYGHLNTFIQTKRKRDITYTTRQLNSSCQHEGQLTFMKFLWMYIGLGNKGAEGNANVPPWQLKNFLKCTFPHSGINNTVLKHIFQQMSTTPRTRAWLVRNFYCTVSPFYNIKRNWFEQSRFTRDYLFLLHMTCQTTTVAAKRVTCGYVHICMVTIVA